MKPSCLSETELLINPTCHLNQQTTLALPISIVARILVLPISIVARILALPISILPRAETHKMRPKLSPKTIPKLIVRVRFWVRSSPQPRSQLPYILNFGVHTGAAFEALEGLKPQTASTPDLRFEALEASSTQEQHLKH